jgi:RNA polymerase sigma-70 factor (ECF subfamily)
VSTNADQDARFREWFEAHRAIVGKVARSFAPQEGEVSQLEQELWFQIWLSIPAFAGEAKPATWIYRVCLNTALTWRRGIARRERRFETGADFARIAEERASPADHAGDRDLLEKLYGAIRLLPDSDRALVLLSLDGLAHREIAEITGLTENHVGVALLRARKRLAASMKGLVDELG